jgi:AcrR family transcriptional regulator
MVSRRLPEEARRGNPPARGDQPARGRPESELRSDSARTRRRLLDAARAALEDADDIGQVTMHGIARAAGVGQGTIYRHFPSREDLLLAVYHVDVEQLVATAPALLAAHPPREALRRWVDQLVSYGQVKRGLGQIVQAATSDAIRSQWRPPVLDALSQLVQAGQASGDIRPDIDAEDVWQLLTFLWSRDTDRQWRARVKRRLDVVLDGLRGPR